MKRWTTLQRTVVASVFAFAAGCASHRIPPQLRGYDVVVEGKDEQSQELARALREYGFRVRDQIRGGGRPTLGLVFFTFADPLPGEPVWLHIRLADTRSGLIMGVGAVVLDSLVPTARARATAVVKSIGPPNP